MKLFFALLVCVGVVFGSISIDHYKCSACLGVVDNSMEYSGSPFLQRCLKTFPNHDGSFCAALFPENLAIHVVENDSRATCSAAGYCPNTKEPWEAHKTQTQPFDLRVSKAFGSRGYNNVRVSVIANHTISSEYFSYTAPFKYRWQSNDVAGNLILHTGIVSFVPGEKTSMVIGGQNIDILIPKKGDGVRGVIVADPCFTSQWIVCLYANRFDTFARTTELLNAIMAHEDTSYFQILGDNFYDQSGSPSSTFFNALSMATKSKVFATVPGNHDFWVNASPKLWVPKDQQGNGFMQFYGQDVKAGEATTTPYDFSNDPDGANKGAENLPPATNFMFYNQIGNVAFIGYSGAHSYASHLSFFKEACNWATQENPAAVVLLNHWNSDGDGCDEDMTSAAVYTQLLALPECSAVAGKMRHFMGHKHCNLVTDTDIGFMVGAMGMSDATGCGGNFGFPIVDTTGGQFRVYYFSIDSENGKKDNYDEILKCVNANGVSGCYHLATLWSATKL